MLRSELPMLGARRDNAVLRAFVLGTVDQGLGEETGMKAPPVPCGSCPYRRDVPSGIWTQGEYDKLPPYDGPTWEQDRAMFLCHQRDGHLCGGWLACHHPRELLALRLNRADPSVYDYQTDVPVFASGAEAREHGMRDIECPGGQAQKMIAGLRKLGEPAIDIFNRED